MQKWNNFAIVIGAQIIIRRGPFETKTPATMSARAWSQLGCATWLVSCLSAANHSLWMPRTSVTTGLAANVTNNRTPSRAPRAVTSYYTTKKGDCTYIKTRQILPDTVRSDTAFCPAFIFTVTNWFVFFEQVEHWNWTKKLKRVEINFVFRLLEN